MLQVYQTRCSVSCGGGDFGFMTSYKSLSPFVK